MCLLFTKIYDKNNNQIDFKEIKDNSTIYYQINSKLYTYNELLEKYIVKHVNDNNDELVEYLGDSESHGTGRWFETWTFKDDSGEYYNVNIDQDGDEWLTDY